MVLGIVLPVFVGLQEMLTDWLPGYFGKRRVFVLGDGPSLRDFDYTRLDGECVIAACGAFFRARSAGFLPQVWVFVDSTFVAEVKLAGIDPYQAPCRIIAGSHCTLKERGSVSLFKSAPGPSTYAGSLYYREHSGAAAINAALLSTRGSVFLLGIDLAFDGTMSHSSPHRLDGQSDSNYKNQIKRYERFEDVFPDRIVNLSPISSIRKFKKLTLDEVLPC